MWVAGEAGRGRGQPPALSRTTRNVDDEDVDGVAGVLVPDDDVPDDSVFVLVEPPLVPDDESPDEESDVAGAAVRARRLGRRGSRCGRSRLP